MMLVARVERIEALAPGEEGRFRVYAFDLEVAVEGDVDPASGMVVNLAEMKRALREEVVGPLSGICLDGRDGRPGFPTPEALAAGIRDLLGGRLAGKRLHRVRLAGRPSPIIDCFEGEGRPMHVTRVYEFSASHRLHSLGLTDEENVRIFGKCNNPSGHGHNYVLEVTLRGEPGESGEIFPGRELDAIVREEVIDRWDHKHLNADVPEFRDINPTAEEIARAAWRRIHAALAGASQEARLHRIKIRETERNHVEYFGDELEGAP